MAADAYEELCDQYKRFAVLDFWGIAQVLWWDQIVSMPDGGGPARTAQLAARESVAHDVLTDDRVGKLLETCENSDLQPHQRAVVRDIRRQYDRAVSVPGELSESVAQAESEAQQAWVDAQEQQDFGVVQPELERVWNLKMEVAEHIDPSRSPYEVWLGEYLPYIESDTVDRIFETLRDRLLPLIDDIRATDRTFEPVFGGQYDVETQAEFHRDLLDLLGFDWTHGRFDPGPRTGTLGNQFDMRIITALSEDSPLAMLGTIHEFGHALYEMGLSREHYGHPLGQSLDGIHESQSRFWQLHVGQSEPFWEFVWPTMRSYFPQLEGRTAQEAYAAVNQVTPSTQRAGADELTYHLHVLIRCEIDRAVVDGDLTVADIPRAWNEKYEEYLGVRPENDTEGCLQDIHWAGGFGTFVKYTVGSVLAAQLDATLREDVDDVDELIREGDFEPLREWLAEHIYRHGRRYPSEQLIERVTGEPLTADYFIEYATQKYSQLYDL